MSLTNLMEFKKEGDVAISNPRACKHCIHYRLNKCLLAMRGVSEDDSCEAFDAK